MLGRGEVKDSGAQPLETPPSVSSVSRSTSPRTILVTALLAMAILGAGVILAATRHGAGTGSDSAVYVSGGQNIARGDGFVWRVGPERARPITHFPPLYSLALALFEIPPVSIVGGALTGARILGVVFFSLSVFLAGWLLFRSTGSWAAGLLGSLTILVTADSISIFSSVMSEGLFLALMLITVLAGSWYARRPSWTRLLAFAALASLLPMTKYAGLSATAAVSVAVFLPREVPRRVRLMHLVVYLMASLSIVALWAWWTGTATGVPLHRSFGMNAVRLDLVKETIQLLPSWVVPIEVMRRVTDPLRLRFLALIAVLLATLAVAIVYFVHRREAPTKHSSPVRADVATLFVAIAGGYLGFHLAATVFSSPAPDTNSRTLGPALLATSIFFVWMVGIGLSALRGPGVVLGAVLVVAAVAYKGPTAYQRTMDLAEHGSGYSSPGWESNAIIAALRELPVKDIYTDDEGAVFLLAGRLPHSLPLKWNLASGEQRPDYERSLEAMRADLQDGAILVLFSPWRRLPEHPSIEELTEGLVSLYQSDGGGIYAWPR